MTDQSPSTEHAAPTIPIYYDGPTIANANTNYSANYYVAPRYGPPQNPLTPINDPSPRIVGLAGWGYSGKDSVGLILVQEGFERRAFADKIRELLYEMNLPLHWVKASARSLREMVDNEGWEAAKRDDDVRSYLQRLGAGCREVFGEDFWVDQVLLPPPTQPLVITDVRYHNEAEAIRRLGGEVWLVKRPGVGPANEFEAEKHSLTDGAFDMIINNYGTLEDLIDTVLLALADDGE